MDTIPKMRISAVIALLILGSIPALGQTFSRAEWSRVKMGRTYDRSQGKAAKVIDRHKATSPSLLKPVGKCDVELKSDELSDFITGVMIDYAAQRMSRATKNPQAKPDLAIVNFRSAKVSLPAGDVTPRDIISLFPIDNQTIVLELKGEYVRKLIRNSAKKTTVSTLAEETIEDDRVYKVVTTDFLFKDQAVTHILKCAEKYENYNMPLGNILIQHIKRVAQRGETIKGGK